MPRVWLLPIALLTACSASTATTEDSTPPDSGAASMSADPTATSGSLDASVIGTAVDTPTVFKMKIRVQGDGTVVKQSAYHRNEAAVPEAVLALAKQRYPGAEPVHFETEVYADLGQVYEIEVDTDGKRCELAARADGTELYTECHADPASLSAAAKATIEGIAPGGKILEVEIKERPGATPEITVEVEHDGQELYLLLDGDGGLMSAWRRVPAIVELPM